MRKQILGVLIHAVRARTHEFLLAVSAGEQSNSESACPSGGKEVPHTIAYDHGFVYGNPEPLSSGKE